MGKFRIKVSSWWANPDYMNLIYSTNGIIWHSIKKCEYDSFGDYYFMDSLHKHYNSCSTYIKKFTNINDVREFHKKESEKVKRLNDEIKRRDKRKKEERKAVYKKFG